MGVEAARRAGKVLEVQSSLSIRALWGGMSLRDGSGQRMNDVHNHFELIFVREGVLPIWEEELAFEVIAGQSLLLWPHRWHWGIENHSPDLCFFWMRFRVDGALPAERLLNGEQTLCVPQYANVSRPDWLESLFRRYLDDQEEGRLLLHRANVLAWLMLAEVAAPRTESESERIVADVAGRALAYIRSHCHLPLTASRIANHLGYNPEYLNRVFHQTYHHTLTEEIHQSRMARARHLLLDSDMSANEIGRTCGFTDIKYFFRLFRRYEGMTPTTFRRLHVRVRTRAE